MIEKGYYPVRMNFYGFWYRSKTEGSMMASIKSNKEKQRHAEEEIRKQAKKIKKNDDVIIVFLPNDEYSAIRDKLASYSLVENIHFFNVFSLLGMEKNSKDCYKLFLSC